MFLDGLKSMKIIGIDFTSRPTKFKPLTCTLCDLDDGVLRIKKLLEWPSFKQFEDFLFSSGPWVAGIDFPFGQSRKFIRNMNWPRNWSDYVRLVGKLDRNEFKHILNAYRKCRPYGDKEHKRATDIAAGSISPQKVYGVPVGLMFFEGAPRLLRAGVKLPGIVDGATDRLVFETYPGVLARRLIGRRSYKQDDRSKQTIDQAEARSEILEKVLGGNLIKDFGFTIKIEMINSDDNDATGDRLDAILCAIQAAWAWGKRDRGFGKPYSLDNVEGWIADPPTCEAMENMADGNYE
jgi:hypothetical protein